MTAVAKAGKALAASLRGASEHVDALRKRIADLVSQQSKIRAEPEDYATIENRVDSLISEARNVDLFTSRTLDMAGTVGALDLYLSKALAVHPFVVFAKMGPERLRETLLALIDRDAGISPEKRHADLRQIDREIFAAELGEEIVLREMEDATGGYISRRGDADPALLLAPTSELLSCIDSEASVLSLVTDKMIASPSNRGGSFFGANAREHKEC